jgi:hypothetical protein
MKTIGKKYIDYAAERGIVQRKRPYAQPLLASPEKDPKSTTRYMRFIYDLNRIPNGTGV